MKNGIGRCLATGREMPAGDGSLQVTEVGRLVNWGAQKRCNSLQKQLSGQLGFLVSGVRAIGFVCVDWVYRLGTGIPGFCPTLGSGWRFHGS